MFLPLNDPFVISGLVLSGLIIVVLVVLLTWTQRRSAREVWDSVRRKPKEGLANSVDGAKDTDSLISISATTIETRDHIMPQDPLPREQLPEDPTDNDTLREPETQEASAAKVVRFSPVSEQQHAPLMSGALPDDESHSGDLGVRKSVRFEPVQQHSPPASPAETFDKMFDKWHRPSDDDDGVEDGPSRPLYRRSMSARQGEELYFQYV